MGTVKSTTKSSTSSWLKVRKNLFVQSEERKINELPTLSHHIGKDFHCQNLYPAEGDSKMRWIDSPKPRYLVSFFMFWGLSINKICKIPYLLFEFTIKRITCTIYLDLLKCLSSIICMNFSLICTWRVETSRNWMVILTWLFHKPRRKRIHQLISTRPGVWPRQTVLFTSKA